MSSLQAVLGEESQEPEAAQETEQVEAAEAETGEAVTPEPSTPDEPSDEAPETEAKASEKPTQVPLKALEEERRKRQEAQEHFRRLELELAELRGRVDSRSPQAQQEEPEDFEEAFYSNPQDYISRVVSQAVDGNRYAMSEQIARDTFPDFDEKLAAFEEAVKTNPMYAAQLRQHPHPGKFAYEVGKTMLETREIGSLDELREKIRQEERARLEQELRKESAQTAASQLTKSVAGSRGASVEAAKAWAGPTPLGDILNG